MLKNLFAFSTEKIGKKIRSLVFGKFVKTCHELDNRERIRDKPTYWTINGEKTAEISAKSNNFILSFRVKCDPKATTYIAFTYPYSYKGTIHILRKHNLGLFTPPPPTMSTT